jgi:hypothetical protein
MSTVPAIERGVNNSGCATDDFWRVQEKKNRAICKQRIGDLNKLFAYRYGGDRATYVFPDDDAGSEDLKILLYHYALHNPLAVPRIIKLRAPWALASLQGIQQELDTYPRKWRSNTLGKLLRLTGAEWKLLRTRTIAPIDMTKEERRAYSRALYRQRRQAKRRISGMVSRAEYEEKSLSRTKPWVAEGICRRTWERRRNECRKSGGNKVTYRDYPLATSEQGGSQRKGSAEQGRGQRPQRTLLLIRSKLEGSDASGDAIACTDIPAAFLNRAEAEWLFGPSAAHQTNIR